jgi:hypothetical protein
MSLRQAKETRKALRESKLEKAEWKKFFMEKGFSEAEAIKKANRKVSLSKWGNKALGFANNFANALHEDLSGSSYGGMFGDGSSSKRKSKGRKRASPPHDGFGLSGNL